jgi:hypothetical protein
VSLVVFSGTGRNVAVYPCIIMLVLRAGKTGQITPEPVQPATVPQGPNAPSTHHRYMAWSRAYPMPWLATTAGASARIDVVRHTDIDQLVRQKFDSELGKSAREPA